MFRSRHLKGQIAAGACAALLLLAAPARADVKAGVDAWSAGDYAAAVSQWQGPASQGDADAEFNLAQAYRLGRGVPPDLARAEALYAKAAAQGHIKAADNYGLMLFQAGRRQEAMPYITNAAGRGDPRAEYLIGLAYFNGDLVPKDWVRAYALVTLANAAGLPQAASALKQMDDYIPQPQREQAQGLAQQIKRESDARRSVQMAAADLSVDHQPGASKLAAAEQPSVLGGRHGAVPQSIRPVSVSPSRAFASDQLLQVEGAPPASSRNKADADFTRPARVAQAAPAPAKSAATSAGMDGPWKVQLGAFGVAGNADRLWNKLSGGAALAGAQKILIPAGRLTRLLAGGFTSKFAADTACAALKRSGLACLVTRQ